MIYVEMDCYALETGVSTHTHTDIQKGWYAGVNIPLPLGVTASRYRLFISLSHQDNFVYTSQLWIFVYTPVIDFSVYTSRT